MGRWHWHCTLAPGLHCPVFSIALSRPVDDPSRRPPGWAEPEPLPNHTHPWRPSSNWPYGILQLLLGVFALHRHHAEAHPDTLRRSLGPPITSPEHPPGHKPQTTLCRVSFLTLAVPPFSGVLRTSSPVPLHPVPVRSFVGITDITTEVCPTEDWSSQPA